MKHCEHRRHFFDDRFEIERCFDCGIPFRRVAKGLFWARCFLLITWLAFLFALIGIFIKHSKAEELKRSYGIHAENDIFDPIYKNEDEYFTHGSKFYYSEESETEKETYSLVQSIYTDPRTSKDTPIEELEKSRPFGGYLYGEYKKQKYISDSRRDTWTFELGCIGGSCSMAEKTQRQVHRWLDQRVPYWNPGFQLKNEPAFLVGYNRAKRIAYYRNCDVQAYGNFLAGNVVDSAGIGIEARTGLGLDKFSLEPITFKVPESPWKAYAFARAEERLVLYNHMLDGSLFRHENHTVESKPFVSEGNLGFVVGYGKFKLAYTFILFSEEWKDQGGAFTFGSVDITW